MKLLTLKNGLKVQLCQRDKTDTVAVSLRMHAGSRYENKSNNGISHAFEHMLLEGTKKYPSRELFNEHMESIGFEFDAGTSHDSIEISSYHPATKTIPILVMLAEIIFSPKLSERSFRLEKKIIFDELTEDSYSENEKYYSLFYRKKIYKNSFISFNNLGTKKNVKNLTIQDIREWHKKCCYPANIVLCLMGDFKKIPNLHKEIKRIFNAKTNKKKLPLTSVQAQKIQSKYKIFFAPHENSEEKVIDFQLNTQIYLRGQKQILQLDLIEKIIKNFINKRLRSEKNLTYSCSVTLCSYSDIQTWHVTSIGDYTKITKILTQLFILIGDLKKGDFSDTLLQNAKEKTLFDIDTTGDDPEYLCSLISEETLLFGDFIGTQKTKSLISKMTKKEVQKILTQIFDPNNFNFIFYGNLTDLQKNNLRQIIHKQLK